MSQVFIRPSKLEEILDTAIESLSISKRLYNCLESEKIKAVREVLSIPETHLPKIRNLGKKTLRELKAVLASQGIPLEIDIYTNPKRYINVQPKRKKHNHIRIKEVKAGKKIYKELKRYEPFSSAIDFYHKTSKREHSFIEYLKVFEDSVDRTKILRSWRECRIECIKSLLKDDYSINETARFLDTSQGVVYYYIRKYLSDVSRKRWGPRGPQNKERLNDIKSLLEKGYTCYHIAKIFGQSRQAIYDYVKRHDLKPAKLN